MRIYFSLIIILLLSNDLLSQKNQNLKSSASSAVENMDFRSYQTIEYTKDLMAKEGIDQIYRLQKELGTKKGLVESKSFILPLVFHVLYSNEDQKISKSQLEKQLDLVNQAFSNSISYDYVAPNDERDFRNLDEYTRRRKDSKIQFCFANEEATDYENSSINYVKVKNDVWTDFNSMKKRNSSNNWDSENFINIWVVNLPGDQAGFAQLPFGPTHTDGIVIDFEFIKNIGDRNKRHNGGHTLTHLIGNYLGLLPIWGDSPCADDGIEDTPIHNAPNMRCHDENHLTTCEGNATEMTNNFMDNTPDECLEIFTYGQVKRMQMVLQEKGPRAVLGQNTRTICQFDPEEIMASEELEEQENTFFDVKNRISMNVRPNPVSSNLFIKFNGLENSDSDFTISMFSVSGQFIMSQTKSYFDTTHTINVSDYAQGVYIIRITQGKQFVTERVIVQ